MDGLSLLTEARTAGLTLTAEAGRLVIRGPNRADATARKLLGEKPAILAALALEQIRATIESARKAGPGGLYGDSLARVLGDFWQIALAYYRQGFLPARAGELEACIRDFVRNAHALAARSVDEVGDRNSIKKSVDL